MYIYTYCHIESIFILNFGLQAKFCFKKFCVLIKVSELCIIRYTIAPSSMGGGEMENTFIGYPK